MSLSLEAAMNWWLSDYDMSIFYMNWFIFFCLLFHLYFLFGAHTDFFSLHFIQIYFNFIRYLALIINPIMRLRIKKNYNILFSFTWARDPFSICLWKNLFYDLVWLVNKKSVTKTITSKNKTKKKYERKKYTRLSSIDRDDDDGDD